VSLSNWLAEQLAMRCQTLREDIERLRGQADAEQRKAAETSSEIAEADALTAVLVEEGTAIAREFVTKLAETRALREKTVAEARQQVVDHLRHVAQMTAMLAEHEQLLTKVEAYRSRGKAAAP
jgi:uncharacterized protein involved in exopolysaccharide biosynthesis